MKFKILLLFVLLFLQFAVVSAQSNSSQKSVCFQPFSYKFDEFNITNVEDATKRLKGFEKKLNEESNEAKGLIYVYGGKQTRIGEAEEIISELGKIIDVKTDYNSKIRGINGGYRSLPSVELYVKPLGCSELPNTISDFDVEQVQFAEAPIKSTVRKSSAQMYDSLLKEIPVECMPAAVAIGLCREISSVEVYVIIDRDGNVIFSKGVLGHPLLKVAAERGVKNWKFKRTEIDGKKLNVVGRINVQIQKSKYEIIAN